MRETSKVRKVDEDGILDDGKVERERKMKRERVESEEKQRSRGGN